MACWLVDVTAETKKRRETILERLTRELAEGRARVVVDRRTGAVAFQGGAAGELAGVGLADTCVYRRLLASNAPGLRAAIMRAEALAGRKVNESAVTAGVHSHDGGKTWGAH